MNAIMQIATTKNTIKYNICIITNCGQLVLKQDKYSWLPYHMPAELQYYLNKLDSCTVMKLLLHQLYKLTSQSVLLLAQWMET